MNVTCPKCESRFKIPEDRIPPGKTATFSCPRCKERMTVKGPDAPAATAPMDFEESDMDGYDASEKPFDFVEEEGKTALICESDAGVMKTVFEALTLMEYQITKAQNARDALKKMRYHSYNVIVFNEHFDTEDPDSSSILIYLQRLQMNVRRNIFVAMLSDRYRTNDQMIAFVKSVNLIINLKNIKDVARIMSSAITDNELFFRPLLEALQDAGRI